MEYKTTLDWLYKWEKEKPNAIYLSQPINGEWHDWTFSEVAIQVRKMASYINSLNLDKNSKIGILSKMCSLDNVRFSYIFIWKYFCSSISKFKLRFFKPNISS